MQIICQVKCFFFSLQNCFWYFEEINSHTWRCLLDNYTQYHHLKCNPFEKGKLTEFKCKDIYDNGNLQSKQVKRTPQDSINELIIWKMNPLVVPVTSVKFKSELLHAKWPVNITRTCLYLVRLKIFEWIKILRRHLHQIQGNWAGTNFVTESRVNSRLILRMREWRDESEIYNCQRTQLSNNKFINGIWGGTLDLVWL